MNSSAKAFNKLPGVLSFQRGLVISDGEFFNEIDGTFEDHPVPVVQHGIRGTQNVNPGNGAENGERTAKGAERAVSNIQTTETAKLAPQASALVVRFRLRMIDLKHALYACASDSKAVSAAALREAVQQFIHRAKGGDGLDEVARRFARNIANGRWLWRNRVIADAITIKVKSADQEVAIFDALDIPLNRFENYSDGEQRLARALAKQMRGTSIDSVEVLARLTFGVRGAVEVFPSQNYVENKPKGFARSLYKLGTPPRSNGEYPSGFRTVGFAALRDQKISNALRTIDTWYDDYKTTLQPLPVEPNGASLDLMAFYRDDRRTSAFALFKQLPSLDPNKEQGMFCIASLIRGGVYSDSDKKAEAPAKPAAAEA